MVKRHLIKFSSWIINIKDKNTKSFRYLTSCFPTRWKLKKLSEYLWKNKIVILDVPLLVENKLYEKDYILVFVDSKTPIILTASGILRDISRSSTRKP